jgi:AcrR family transcriptional regulator
MFGTDRRAMSTAQVKSTGVGTRRPRDRRAQILAAAAAQFGTVGYSNANISEIADAVGITAGALYKHFRNKESMLTELTLEGSDRFVAALADDTADFASTMSTLVSLAVSRRDIGVLWQREARNLPEHQRTELRDRRRYCQQRVGELIAAHRPASSADECRLLADALIAILLSPSYHRAQVPSERYRSLLETIIARVVDVRFDQPEPSVDPVRTLAPARHTRRSRREVLLGEATTLFAERGFHAVTMDEIGQSAGMAGPSVYNHFAKKDDILIAALNRGADMLDIGLNKALAHAESAAHGVHLSLVSYIESMTDHPALVTIVVNETASLTDPLRHQLRSRQREYVDEWVHLLASVHPGTDTEELRATVLAAITVVNIVVVNIAVDRFTTTPAGELVHELACIGDAVLGLDR